MYQTDSGSQERYFQDDVSTTSTYESENSMITVNGLETEEAEEMDTWIPLIENPKERSNTDFDEINLKKAYKQWSR